MKPELMSLIEEGRRRAAALPFLEKSAVWLQICSSLPLSDLVELAKELPKGSVEYDQIRAAWRRSTVMERSYDHGLIAHPETLEVGGEPREHWRTKEQYEENERPN